MGYLWVLSIFWVVGSVAYGSPAPDTLKCGSYTGSFLGSSVWAIASGRQQAYINNCNKPCTPPDLGRKPPAEQRKVLTSPEHIRCLEIRSIDCLIASPDYIVHGLYCGRYSVPETPQRRHVNPASIARCRPAALPADDGFDQVAFDKCSPDPQKFNSPACQEQVGRYTRRIQRIASCDPIDEICKQHDLCAARENFDCQCEDRLLEQVEAVIRTTKDLTMRENAQVLKCGMQIVKELQQPTIHGDIARLSDSPLILTCDKKGNPAKGGDRSGGRRERR